MFESRGRFRLERGSSSECRAADGSWPGQRSAAPAFLFVKGLMAPTVGKTVRGGSELAAIMRRPSSRDASPAPGSAGILCGRERGWRIDAARRAG